MAHVQLVEFDVDLETHMKFGDVLGDAPIPGLILHAGGSSERGVYSLDVWETKEDAQRFFAERMVPALRQLGIEDGPPLSYQVFEMPYVVHGLPGRSHRITAGDGSANPVPAGTV